MTHPIGITGWRRSARSSVVCLGVLLLAACAQRLAVPAEFGAPFQVLEVQGRSWASGDFVDEGFELGPYRVHDVDRDWDSTITTDVGPVSNSDVDGGYSYEVSAGTETLAARCVTSSGNDALDLGKGWSVSSPHSRLACSCGDAVLAVEAEQDESAGTLNWNGHHLVVRSISELEGGGQVRDPAGYRFDADEPFALVEVLHPGRAWLTSETLADRPLPLACALVGLLLYQAPSEP
jgi:hypothetical protein